MSEKLNRVVVGMENGQGRWIEIDGVKVTGVVDVELSLEAQRPVMVRLEFMAGDLRAVPHNIHDPDLKLVKEALGL